MSNRLKQVIKAIDAANADDPRTGADGRSFEHVYSGHMTSTLDRIYPDASKLLHIAARAQHIRRWDIARTDYPEGRKGYNQWRKACRVHHAEITGGIMTANGYSADDISHVAKFLKKEQLKKDADSQALENVVDVVFLAHYWDDFAAKFSQYDDEKLIGIIGKTLLKMSSKGHEAALALDLPEKTRSLVMAAIEQQKDKLEALAKAERIQDA